MKLEHFFLSVALLLSTGLAAQTSGTCGANLTWTLSNGVLTITGTGAMNDFGVGKAPWYANRSSIISLVIDNSVTSIGDNAFYGCSNMTHVSLSNNLTSIGYQAFFSCRSLPIENNVRYADYYVVGSVGTTLTSYPIKSGTKWIGKNAFEKCSNMASVSIPTSVEIIDDNAFNQCSSLTSIFIPDSVISIGDYAFRKCTSLTSISGGNGLTSIGASAFEQCIGLTIVNIPNRVTSIGDYAFMACRTLTTLSIPERVTNIGSRAFGNCDSIAQAYVYSPIPIAIAGQADWDYLMIFYTNSSGVGIPKHLTIYVPCASLDAYKSANYWCDYASRMESLPLPDVICNVNDTSRGTVNTFILPTACDSVILTAVSNDGYGFSKWSDGNTDNPRFAQITQDTTFTAEFIDLNSGQCGDSLYWSFSGDTLYFSGMGDMDSFDNDVPWKSQMSQLRQIVFAPEMTSITEGAFYRAGNLTSVSIPDKVTRIGDRAFLQCCVLSTITFGAGLQTIGDYGFAYSSNINTMTSYNTTPPAVGSEGFREVLRSVILYVPASALDDYKQHPVWGGFDVRPLDTAIEDITCSPSPRPQKIFHDNQLYILLPDGTRYDATGKKVE